MRDKINIWRDDSGIPHVEADDLLGMFWGLGYVHARDRGMQILLMRTLGQGRGCELLDDSDDMLGVDTFFRRMNWAGHMEDQMETLSSDVLGIVQSYCDGVNAGFAKKKPWECKLLGLSPDPWEPKDSMLISRMVGYLTLSQSQGEVERLFVEMVQAGVDEERLEELFPGLLEGADFDLIRKVELDERIVAPTSLWDIAAPRMMASNNWVIAGSKTVSGEPILSNDPHLETNRLPNVWCEVVLKMGERFLAGGSMPGLPGVLVGRNNDVSWGATYTFMDAQDSWVEHCRDGKYKRLDEDGKERWRDFFIRDEVIHRKKNSPEVVTFYENDHGVLDGEPPQNGFKLCSRWASGKSGATSIQGILNMWEASTVEEGMEALGRVETAWNFVFADTSGNIGYQMSGMMPKRPEGVRGFIPLAGWDPENDWQGFVHHHDLPRCLNPEEGFIVTANHNLNHLGKEDPINMPMGGYRAERITQLLAEKDDWSAEDVFKMHFDLYSLQAERYLEILRPLLPDSTPGKLLAEWDLCYELNSRGACLFERFYRALFTEVFGVCGVGRDAVDFLTDETGIFIDFYEHFDKVLWKEDSLWFQGKTREELYTKAIKASLIEKPKSWGHSQRITMANILLGGKFPRFFGFDRGPIPLPGGRATIHQGQIYKSAGRTSTFAPSFRMVVEMDKEGYRSNLAGGPSDRRFSRWYCSDLKNWQQGRYKTVTPAFEGKRIAFV